MFAAQVRPAGLCDLPTVVPAASQPFLRRAGTLPAEAVPARGRAAAGSGQDLAPLPLTFQRHRFLPGPTAASGPRRG